MLLFLFLSVNIVLAQKEGFRKKELKQSISIDFIHSPHVVDSLHTITKKLVRKNPDSAIRIVKKNKIIKY